MSNISSWEQIMRYDGQKIYITYKCPTCNGTGLSPYVDANYNPIPCECCHGKGYER